MDVPATQVEEWCTDVFANETWVPKKIRAAQLVSWPCGAHEKLISVCVYVCVCVCVCVCARVCLWVGVGEWVGGLVLCVFV